MNPTTTTAPPERNTPVTTAPARPLTAGQTTPSWRRKDQKAEPAAPVPRTVTAEDADKATKAIVDLDRVERLVTTVLVVLGVGGLIFTAVNVTMFATGHHIHWGIAWMLDPLVSISLLAALFIDGKLAAHGYRPGGWPFVLRWFAGLATWLMNCWGSLYPDAQFTGWPSNPDPAGLLLHSVIPALVIFLAEAGAGYRKFSTRKKAEHRATLNAWKDQEEARRKTDAEARRRREEDERKTREEERKRAADLAAEEKRAELEARKARDLADAKAREIRATEEAEARRAERERAAAETRRKNQLEDEERHKIAEERQARIDRENAEHAAKLDRQRILTEGEAEAAKIKAEGEVKAAEAAREERRRTAESRRASTAKPTAIPAEHTAIPTAEVTAIPDRATAIRTAETTAIPQGGTALPAALPGGRTAIPSGAGTAEPQKPTAVPTTRTAETDDIRGAEAKRKQIEEATFEAAVLIFTDRAPTRKEFAARYGRGETWGRDRYAEAEQHMDKDADYAARVLGEAEKRKAA